MALARQKIVVIGTSAGGLEALDELVGQFPGDLPATILIVQHMPPEAKGNALLYRLSQHRAIGCKLAENGETFKRGWIYIAPPDYHLLIKKTQLLVTKGARENRFRPAIDPLFRSAAVEHGPRVIGVLLTGLLNDGTAGLLAIQRCGGLTIVQDPDDAAYPDMPRNALNNLQVDHCVGLSELGGLIDRLSRQTLRKQKSIPSDVRLEAKIAERVLSSVEDQQDLGDQVPYNCPNCGGVLWEMKASRVMRYRCHTGHAFTSQALLDSQSEKIEETLWTSLRMFEERKNLLTAMQQKEKHTALKHTYSERVKENQVHIERIRAMLLSRDKSAKNSS